jgi:hypothetical protein
MERGGSTMTDGDRVILDGVDRYRVMDPLFEGVRVVLSYRGETYSPAYVQGISGAAFRIGGICPCAPTCAAAMESPDLPRLFGYEVQYYPLYEEGIDLQAEGEKVVAMVKDEIRAGRPALVWHAFTTAEWDVVAGFDDGQDQFLGRGSYAGLDDHAVADQMRLITCLEICPAIGAIRIGEKTGSINARAAELAALEEAVKHARTRRNPLNEDGGWAMLDGIQCYDRWVADVTSDPKVATSMGSRYCYGVYRSTHRAAAGFLQELAAKYPGAAEALTSAAACFVKEADTLDAAAPYMSWQAPEELDAQATEEAYNLMSAARDAYVRGIEGVEQALDELR